jgi:hypothetical protein
MNNNQGGGLIPPRMEPVVFGFILSGLMSSIVAGVSTVVANGGFGGPPLLGLWVRSWLTAWLLAFPIVLVVAPLARRIVRRLVRTG